MNITKTILWTDSQVTLTWIKAHPSRWKDYVHNRVIKIQELSRNAHWRYVSGTSNPADCASRGISTDQLEKHTLWWTGPPWITQSMASWPAQVKEAPNDSCAQEACSRVVLHTVRSSPSYQWDLIHRFSTLNRLLRVTALCSRFIKRLSGELDSTPAACTSVQSMEDSRLFWVKATQSAYYSEEISVLSRQSQLPSSHPLSRLTAFIDAGGVHRMDGRLSRSKLMYEAKHPAILPRSSRLSELVIAYAHKKTMHGGTQSTLALIRQLYWIIGGRARVCSLQGDPCSATDGPTTSGASHSITPVLSHRH
ncbi:PREDICTED: uncharacterized protein LOC107073773 [Polistes dominula]|uniref:Uncharacterized protein LOC107073773 n=1 Tax=Polistes dominula TaxID=743375 RepID=A0ABM1JBW8_POLDO|nr:PREDICTED: uncharacterized protein LOC107073773 [Polistes dominula]